MSDYMRGYSKRNRRRRASYKKTNTLYENSYYSKRSRWLGRDVRTRRKRRNALTALLGGLIILVCAGVFFWVHRHAGNSGKTPDNPTVAAEGNVTSAAVAASGTSAVPDDGAKENKDALTKAVDAVDTLGEDAVAKPTPKPRSKAVALSFDDGPSTQNTMRILNTLKKYNAHATFFVVGNRVSAGADLLKKELEYGCEIGNHSWQHDNYSLMKIKKVNKDLQRTAKLVKKKTGYTIRLVRPPYGAISDVMRKKLKNPMILWSVDTLDWKTRNAKAVLKEVKKQTSDGAVILMHDIHESTADALDSVLSWLVKNDYDVLTVSELMARNGQKMKNGKAYCNA